MKRIKVEWTTVRSTIALAKSLEEIEKERDVFLDRAVRAESIAIRNGVTFGGPRRVAEINLLYAVELDDLITEYGKVLLDSGTVIVAE